MATTFSRRPLVAIPLAACLWTSQVAAQGTASDYMRAEGLRARYETAAVDVVSAPSVVGDTHGFWYRKSVKGGEEFEFVDADTLQKRPPFDHERVAASLSRESGATYTALRLPFTNLTFTPDGSSFTAAVERTTYRCTVTDSSCRRAEPTRGGRGLGGGRPRTNEVPRRSPDGKWDALVDNFNVAIRAAGGRTVTHLSTDGSEGNYYDGATIAWSPDSKKIAAYKVRPGYRREVHYVESSPEDQLQPKHSTLTYAKPGDVLDVEQPVLFDIGSNEQVIVDHALFPNPYQNSELLWRKDSRAFTFEYNQRGHFAKYYRINFDGTGLTPLTGADANHAAAFTSDMKFYADTYSRVDLAPVLEIHRTTDNALLATLERGDLSELKKTGWTPPEVFVAKGRDGQTDIWGVIIRPSNFDPRKKYPVIENIYAGPQGSFVPKTFGAWNQMMSQAELGFIVVQIDGMGTSNRSKAFHDVAWQNLGDAGFPDRIMWHKAVAAKYPYYDITRVGIYGGSAGGQNALGGLLFHPEFYKAGVAYAGCHDNRMDKIWWNEQWMGWPIGPQYSASSNVDNASRLQGDLLLVVGELDTNVDPSSTMQVVNQLIKHNKNFDLLVVPGANHSAGRGSDPTAPYGDHKRFDFFVQHLLGVAPLPWNQVPTKTSNEASRQQ